MQKTEKYTVFVGKSDGIKKEDIITLWLELVQKVKKDLDIFIQADFTETTLLCNAQVGCSNSELVDCVRIICIRNPRIQNNEEIYNRAIYYIFTSIRSHFKEIYAIVEKENVNVGFYIP